MSAKYEAKYMKYSHNTGDQLESASDTYSTRIRPRFDGIIEPEAATRVKEALLYIDRTAARLLDQEKHFRQQGNQQKAAIVARSRAELIPLRTILREN